MSADSDYAVIIMNAALHGYAPSNAVFSSELNMAISQGQYAYSVSLVPPDQTTEFRHALSVSVLHNMGLDHNERSEDLTIALQQVFALNHTAIGQVILNLGNILSNLTSDAVYGSAARAWNANLVIAHDYSATPGHNSSQPFQQVTAAASSMSLAAMADVDVDFMFSDSSGLHATEDGLTHADNDSTVTNSIDGDVSVLPIGVVSGLAVADFSAFGI